MSRIYDLDFKALTYEDYEKEVIELFNSIQVFYMELFDVYNELCTCLDEKILYKDSDLSSYILARDKVKYLSQKLSILTIQERELYYSNKELLPYLEEHIKRKFNLGGILNSESFSLTDPLIFEDFAALKDNYFVMRMIRCLKFYDEYYDFRILRDIYKLKVSDDEIIAGIQHDFSDIESILTMQRLSEKFTEIFDVHLCNKYKCLFSFVNPRVEYLLIETEFDDPYIGMMAPESEDEKKKLRKIVSTKTIFALLAIEHNPIINHEEGGRLLLDEPDGKDVEKYNKYFKDKDELFLLYAFLLQNYDYLPVETVEDLDHLLSEMCKFTDKQYDDVKLSKRVVDYFFRRDAYDSEYDYERKREDEE